MMDHQKAQSTNVVRMTLPNIRVTIPKAEKQSCCSIICDWLILFPIISYLLLSITSLFITVILDHTTDLTGDASTWQFWLCILGLLINFINLCIIGTILYQEGGSCGALVLTIIPVIYVILAYYSVHVFASVILYINAGVVVLFIVVNCIIYCFKL